MNKFKSIMMTGHTQNKEYLHKLYTDRQVYISSVSSSEQPIEDEKVFYYRTVSFQFMGTGFRTPEKTILYVWISKENVSKPNILSVKANVNAGSPCVNADTIPCEDFLLRMVSEPINRLSDEMQNEHKDAREKTAFSIQTVNSMVCRRNGCIYVQEKQAFRLRISFQIPLVNGHSINGKSAYKGMKRLLDCICDCMEQMNVEALQEHVRTWQNQQAIRDYMNKKELIAFVADGSILPREGENDEPLASAIPFLAPRELKRQIILPDGQEISGMGIERGITIITGGGYSGKSTLLDALEQGIYNHIKGDGREYCLMEESACKIYAEEGRYVSNTDLSPFYTFLPGNGEVNKFSTHRASGSVSQAANIVEAVYGGCRCLLIDEDSSAVNFMIRDETMRKLVKKEPIIPYTDRIYELKEMGISTILVIGGTGEYLKYADNVLLLEDYIVYDRTDETKGLTRQENEKEERTDKVLPAINVRNSEDGASAIRLNNNLDVEMPHTWMENRYLKNPRLNQAFFFSECVQIENARYIRIDDYVVDITKLTAIVGQGQVNSLAYLLEKILGEKETDDVPLRERCENVVEEMFEESMNITLATVGHRYELCLEEVRSIDLLMAICKLRGVVFVENLFNMAIFSLQFP